MRVFFNIGCLVLLAFAMNAVAQQGDLIFKDSFELCPDPNTIEWDGGGDGTSWSDPLNWKGDVVPGDGASVTIRKAGNTVVFNSSATDTTVSCLATIVKMEISTRTLTIDGPGAFSAGLNLISGVLNVNDRSNIRGGLQQSGGTVGGFGNLNVNGPYDWSGGTQRDSGTTTINGTTTLTGGNHDLRERTLTLVGVTNWNSGNIRSGYAATLNIEDAFNIQSDVDMTNLGSTTPTININAALTKTAGAGLTELDANFNNNSTVTVSTGQLTLGRPGATGTSSGDFSVASFSTLTIEGAHTLAGNLSGGGNFILNGGSVSYVTTITGTFSFNGTLEVKSGRMVYPNAQAFPDDVSVTGSQAILDFNDAVTISKDLTLSAGTLTTGSTLDIGGMLTQSAGTLAGFGTVTVTGAYNWSGGTQRDSGTTTINGTTTLTGGNHDLRERILTLVGVTNWISGNIRSGYAATLNIEDAFNIQSDVDMTNLGSTTPTININGALTKTAGGGLTELDANFNNNSTVTVSTGQLTLGRPGATGTSSGDFSVASFSTLTIEGAHTLAGNLSGDGNFILNGGSVSYVTTITGTFSFNGTLEVKSGRMVYPNAQAFPDDVSVTGSQAILDFQGAVTISKDLTLSAGTLTTGSTLDIGGMLTQSAGTLAGFGTVTVTGAYNWSGGTQRDSGTTTINGTTTLTGGNHDLRERILTLVGVTNWISGNIRSGYAATLNIEDAFNIQSDVDMTNLGSTTPTININGALTKTAGGGLTELDANFNNNSTVTVSTGQLTLGRPGATGTSSGDFSVASFSTLTIEGAHTLAGNLSGGGNFILNGGSVSYVTTITGTFSFNGTLEVKSGRMVYPNAQAFPDDVSVTGSQAILDFQGAVTISKDLTLSAGTLTTGSTLDIGGMLTQSAGTLAGFGTVTVTGAYNWSGGTQRDSGTTTINGTTTLTGGNHDLRERTLTLVGVTNWNSGNIRSGYAATLNIEDAFNIQSDVDMTNLGSTTPTININAALTKTAGAGLTELDANFNNNSTVTVSTGQLTLGRPGATGTSSGDFSVASFSTLTIEGAHTLAGNLSGGGNFILNGGSVSYVTTITGTFSFNGTLEVKSGRMVYPNAQAFPDDVSVTGSQAILDFNDAVTISKDLTLSAGTLTTGSTLDIGGMLTQSAGTLAGFGTVTVTGAYNWSGGTQRDSGTTTINGTTTLTGGNHDLRERILTLVGVTNWISGNIRSGYAATLNIEDAFNIQSDVDMTNLGSTTPTININGALTKTAGGGLTSFWGDIVNAGSISVLTGQLSFQRAYTQNSTGTLEVNISSLSSFDAFAVSLVATLDGALQVNLLDGYTPNQSDNFVIMTFSSVNGTFAAVNVNPSGGFNVNYNATDITLVVP